MSEQYPALGRTMTIDFGTDGPFGPFAADLTFSDTEVSFVVTKGSLSGKEETCDYKATHVRDGVWVVTWQEIDLLTVVQTQDFTTGALVSAVTTSDQALVQLDGSFSMAV